MDKSPPKKFPNNGDSIENTEQEAKSNEFDKLQNAEDASSDLKLIVPPLLENVDRYLETLSSNTNDNSQVPGSVESLLTLVENKMANFDDCKFGHQEIEELIDYTCLTRISKLINALNECNSNSSKVAALNRATTVLHLVMSLLDNKFRLILDSCLSQKKSESKTPKSLTTIMAISSSLSLKQPSNLGHQDFDQGIQPENQPTQEEDQFPGYSEEAISYMNKIATAMITLGYEKECCMAYNMLRKNAFNLELDKLGFNNISIEDVQRMPWESLEVEISSWIQVFKHCSSILFPGEQKLCDSVFAKYPSISRKLFSDLASAITVRFLNFTEAITLMRRSAEKLFKFLDMYETLRDTVVAIDEAHATDLKSETHTVKIRLGEAAVAIFCDLENSIRRDNGKTPVPSGAVHPLTRYTMNYLRYACEYKNTLEQVFLQNVTEGNNTTNTTTAVNEDCTGANEDGTPKTSPFAVQLNAVMDLLDENLEMKSKLYRDPSLGYVFLMNNGRYILQKIKGSDEVNDIMGATWCRKRSSDLRLYHKGYTRETWSRLLQCLSHEGLQVNGKVAKPVLKERFKIFNAMIDEIHKTQSTWVVSDEQLQSEIRVSVSAVVIPAYRSFLGRFEQYLTLSRQTEKYIKYQPEDIENLIEELFAGNPNSISRRKP